MVAGICVVVMGDEVGCGVTAWSPLLILWIAGAGSPRLLLLPRRLLAESLALAWE